MKFINLILLLGLFGLASMPAQADSETKPFAEKRIVLQISDPNPMKQTLVLNVASNLMRHYGADKVDVEIVAFGPGLRLLMAGNSNQSRIAGLNENGVRFSACENTIAGFARKLGHQPELVSQAVPVTAGVVRILELTEQGYNLIKP